MAPKQWCGLTVYLLDGHRWQKVKDSLSVHIKKDNKFYCKTTLCITMSQLYQYIHLNEVTMRLKYLCQMSIKYTKRR